MKKYETNEMIKQLVDELSKSYHPQNSRNKRTQLE